MKYLSSSKIELQISNEMSDYILNFLISNKMNRHDLCEKLNIKYSTINRILTGHQYMPISLVLKFSDCFDDGILKILFSNKINLCE